MVNMMLRPPYEGSTLFAKIMNVWLLGQAPVVAHRNRIADLTQKLVQETMRVHAKGRVARVFNLGCGPADEIQQFLKDHPISEQASFYLLDFNDETLRFLQSRLEDIRKRNNRSTPVQLVKKSVHQVLKEGGRSLERGAAVQYDFVYCAGLFDYLTGQVCKRLMNIFYNLLAPGGLLVATNVSDTMNSSRPFRYSMEYILEWNLIYRNGRQVADLAPDAALPDNVAVINENTGVNTFIEVRKPDA
jgi:extracellular factor (EF) 3-hydroxypalmitic acid methyl ester biosynthesis protein